MIVDKSQGEERLQTFSDLLRWTKYAQVFGTDLFSTIQGNPIPFIFHLASVYGPDIYKYYNEGISDDIKKDQTSENKPYEIFGVPLSHIIQSGGLALGQSGLDRYRNKDSELNRFASDNIRGDIFRGGLSQFDYPTIRKQIPLINSKDNWPDSVVKFANRTLSNQGAVPNYLGSVDKPLNEAGAALGNAIMNYWNNSGNKPTQPNPNIDSSSAGNYFSNPDLYKYL